MTDKEKFLIRFGAHLSTIRTGKKLSIEDLSDRSGIDSETIVAVEAGTLDLDLVGLFDIAAALGMEPKDMVP